MIESFIARRYFLGMGRLSPFAVAALVILPTPLDLLCGMGVLVAALVRGRRISLITVISVISLLGIKVGVAALICVLSVFNGFNGVVKGLFVGFDPHLRVTPVAETTLDADSMMARIRSLQEVTAAAPFVSGRSAIMLGEGLKVVQIRGMSAADSRTAIGLHRSIYNGTFPDPSPERPHPIVLGAAMAYSLNASVGDTIALLSQKGLEQTMTQLEPPTLVRCIVTGTFSSNNKEYDENVAYTDLGTAREIFAVETGAMGVEIRLRDFELAPAVQPRLQALLGARFRVETWQDLHRDLFAVMELERWAAFVILSLIVVVAVFNVLGSLTMTVIEKRRDIGILKTMGASDRTVLRTYLYEGAIIGLVGTLGGVLIGTTVCLLQMHYGFFTLNNAVYIIPALPVELRMADVIVITATALALALGAALYPAFRASRVLPADAVRWE